MFYATTRTVHGDTDEGKTGYFVIYTYVKTVSQHLTLYNAERLAYWWNLTFRHHASYIGQAYSYSPEYTFYIFSQQIYLIFLDLLSPSAFIPPQNILYFLMLLFLVHKIFTFYINGVLNCKCPAPGPKG